jgi:hypothetical protein
MMIDRGKAIDRCRFRDRRRGDEPRCIHVRPDTSLKKWLVFCGAIDRFLPWLEQEPSGNYNEATS